MTRLELRSHDVVGIRAGNPGPFTLTGTNTWIVGRSPAWLIDPGPVLDEHVRAVMTEVTARGGLGGIALTHDHSDHADAVPALRGLFPDATFAAVRGDVDVRLAQGVPFGPLAVLPTPGHAPDHVAFVADNVGFTGDAVLGEGSVFITPDPGALADYLAGLEQLRNHHLEVLAPGHGEPVAEPARKLDEYIRHRAERERRLLAALAAGRRTVDALLAEVWDDVPEHLRPAAAVTLAAHLDKLEDEGRLPADVERPARWW